MAQKSVVSRTVKEGREEEEEDYGDYTTRCICGYTHDDGFMVQCDGCSVWQHVECITVNPNNLPDKYLCEICHPRTVDKKRARQLQHKKRDDLSDLDDNRQSPSTTDSRVDHRKLPPHPSMTKRRRKQSKDSDSKPSSEIKKTKKEKGEGRRGYRKGSSSSVGGVRGGERQGGGGGGKIGSIQCLLNAATLIEAEREGGRQVPTNTWKGLWSADNSPWCDKYDTAEHNRFSETVRQFLSSHLNQLKSEAVVFEQQEYNSMENHTHPQCLVTEVQRRRMGVVAQVEVPEDELVLEYKGKIAVLSAVLADFPAGTKSLWKQMPCPFVYIYDKINDLDICIDARHCGNLARFIRRSCCPNSELRHFFVGSDLHLGVYATHIISHSEEVTLPFDFHVEKCDYPLECGCGRKNCWVVRASRGRPGRGVKEDSVEREQREEAEKTVAVQPSRGSTKPHPPQLSAPPTHDEDSNSSWTSSSGTRRKPHGHTHQSPASNLIGRLGGGEGESRHASHEGSSDSDDDGGDRKKKVKSREERKTEAVMKMFQRMEASSQRRRRHLTSEGSADSDTHSPSHHSSHTTTPTTHRTSVIGQRERRGSTSGSSRKPIMLPQTTKTRLSSVSSNEGFSSADLPDTFSPPATPRLGSLTSPHALSSPLPPSPLPLTLTPTSCTHSPTVRFTPDLHPKYLLAQFPMPLKKALLRQWESDKHGFHGNQGKPCPLWPSDHMTLTEGYLTTGWSNAASFKPRTRGSLKHRWLKQYSEETPSDGKENISTNYTTTGAPLKRRLLLRWQESESEMEKSLSLVGGVGKSLSILKMDGKQSDSDSKSTTAGVGDEEEGNVTCDVQSPLFEEFSDNEFDVERDSHCKDGEKGEREGVDGKDIDLSSELMVGGRVGGKGLRQKWNDKQTIGSDVTETQFGEPSINETTPTMSNFRSSGVNDRVIRSDEGSITSSLPAENNTCLKDDIISNISTDMNQESDTRDGDWRSEVGSSGIGEGSGVSGGVEKVSEIVRKTKSLEELMLEDMVTSEVVKDEIEERVVGSEGGRKEGRVSSGKSLEELMVMDMAMSIGGEGESGAMFLDPRESFTGQLPGKTPGKRKINLSEYRSRVRRPAVAAAVVDQKKDIVSEHNPSSSSTSPQHTYFPPTFTPSHLTYSIHTPTNNPTTPLLGGGVVNSANVLPPPPPQFEPVSPDDCQPLHSDGSTQSRGPVVGVMPGHIPMGVLPGMTSTPLQPAPPTFIPPGSHTTATYGMETMWTAPQLEPSQDPRRHMMGGANHGGLLPHPQPHMQPHPGTPTHVLIPPPLPSPTGDYPTHQPHPPHGYSPARRPPSMYRQHHPDPSGTGGNLY